MRARLRNLALLAAALAIVLTCERQPVPAASKAWPALPVDPSGLSEALRPVFAPALDLEGCWRANWLPGYDLTDVCVRRTGELTFALEFYRATDVGPGQSSKVGTWSGNGLQLGQPEALFEVPIRALYPARVEGQECLVPDLFLMRLEAGRKLWSESGDEFAFRRIDELEDTRLRQGLPASGERSGSEK